MRDERYTGKTGGCDIGKVKFTLTAIEELGLNKAYKIDEGVLPADKAKKMSMAFD